jgi:hypothetical protein
MPPIARIGGSGHGECRRGERNRQRAQHRTMSAINQRMARSLSVSAPINSATYRIGAGSESICRPLHRSHASAFRLQGCQTSRFRSSTSASRRFRCPSMADSAALSRPVGVPPPSACHRQSCWTGSAVRPVSIRRRSRRSDIPTCCGRNGRGSLCHRIVNPFQLLAIEGGRAPARWRGSQPSPATASILCQPTVNRRTIDTNDASTMV